MSNSMPMGPLGEAKQGRQPALYGFMDGGNERSLSRKHLAKAFGNLYNTGLKSSPVLFNKNILGPFRTATNAGDIVTNNMTPTNIKYGRAPNQVGGNNLARLQPNVDGVNRGGNAMYSGNPKYVYDGSDYIKFKKLQAINKNFNDKSFGGANHNNTQSVIRRIRS
jgi:hypothetical protein